MMQTRGLCNIGYLSLITAAQFKSQKILSKARTVGSNLLQGRLSTSHLPILEPVLKPTLPFTQFTPFLCHLPIPDILWVSRRDSVIHVFSSSRCWFNSAATSSFPLKNGRGGKRPWHRLVTCLLVHPKILGVIN